MSHFQEEDPLVLLPTPRTAEWVCWVLFLLIFIVLFALGFGAGYWLL